ncbi:MAG: alpha/beta fold hydrolase [Chloroflexota bacterium]
MSAARPDFRRAGSAGAIQGEVTSPDGARIAYDCCGAGPAVILLHGGGSRRQEWHTAGYVARLQEFFTVITMDLRGHGESACPVDPADYALEKQAQDILTVAAACGASRFILWGFSYGSKVGRYVAVQSGRVERVVLMSATLGPGAAGRLRQDVLDFCAHWPPILQARQAGALDLASLSAIDQDLLLHYNVPAMLGWGTAMLDWPAVEPADFPCPALWLIGAEDEPAMTDLQQFQPRLVGSQLRAQVMEGLDHGQVFDEIERVFPTLLAFSKPA